jgi:glucokinase
MSDFLLEPVLRFKPDALIVCGNIAKASGFFLPAVAAHLNMTTLKVGQLGEFAALIGAADLFLSNANEQQMLL